MLPRCIRLVITLLVACVVARADDYVVVIADVSPAYARARVDAQGNPRTETYVMMQGRFFAGMLRDRSIDRLSFRELADRLAPELARQRFMPAPGPEGADLLLVVHWGTTIPQVGLHEMLARPTQELDHDKLLYETIQRFNPGASADEAVGGGLPGGFFDLPPEYRPKFGQNSDTATGFTQLEEIAHETSQQLRRSDNASLLGYNNGLQRDSKRIWSGEEGRAMRYDLNMERYFIIVRAYDLKRRTPGASSKKPAWTMHLNISAPGNNFKSALTRMGEGVARFAGQGDGSLSTFRAGKEKIGSVKLGELIILGEVSQK